MARKKYGIYGLMEYQGCFYAGKAEVNVHFKGGMLTAYGVTPATFTTENKLVQVVLENSSEFKSGRIRILDVDYSEEELKAAEEAKAKQEAEAKEQAEQALRDAEKAAEEKNVVRFSDWGEARQWLIDQGVAASELTGNKKIQAKAEALGYTLQIE